MAVKRYTTVPIWDTKECACIGCHSILEEWELGARKEDIKYRYCMNCRRRSTVVVVQCAHPDCMQTFSHNKGKVWCSRKCQLRFKRQKVIHSKMCDSCNTSFKTDKKRVRYCSVKCYKNKILMRQRVKNHCLVVEKGCVSCGAMFFGTVNKKYCTRQCRYQAHLDRCAKKREHTRLELKCAVCGIFFRRNAI